MSHGGSLLETKTVDEVPNNEVSASEQVPEIDGQKFDFKEVVPVDDDFIVPATFSEFYDRYPKYVRTWLIRHRCPQDLLEDFEHDIFEHFLTVSDNGRAKGIHDRIMSFSGDRIGGKSAGKFFYYINLLLTRRYMILIDRRVREPISKRNTLSINNGDPDQSETYVPGSVTVEELYSKHGCTQAADLDMEKLSTDREFINGFLAFLKKNEPELLASAAMFMNSNTMSEMAEENSMAIKEVNKIKNRLKIMANLYSKGCKGIPRSRRKKS